MSETTPEGTRSKTSYWRTGFYYMALNAGVPIAFGSIDYATRTIGIQPGIEPTGDLPAEPAADAAAGDLPSDAPAAATAPSVSVAGGGIGFARAGYRRAGVLSAVGSRHFTDTFRAARGALAGGEGPRDRLPGAPAIRRLDLPLPLLH